MGKIIVFITKSLCYHQVYLADELYSIYGKDFYFIQVRSPLDFRVANNQEGFNRPYLLSLDKEEERSRCYELISIADALVVGEASWKIVKNSKKTASLFYYSERIRKPGFYKFGVFHFFLDSINLIRKYFHLKHRKAYLLSAGPFATNDFNRFGIFRNKSYVWGYFPSVNDKPINKEGDDSVIKIVWVSRFLKWKHPIYAIKLAEYLKKHGIDFRLNLIGDGDAKGSKLLQKLKNKVSILNLNDNVHFLGKIKPDEVISNYKESDLAIFTSGSAEGWGVGVNEAMSCSCCTVVSNEMGSSPYLIKDGVNGVVYNIKSLDDFFDKCMGVIKNKNLRDEIGYKGYETIKNEWNYQIAAERLSVLIDSVLEDKDTPFKDGICSRAHATSKWWYKK